MSVGGRVRLAQGHFDDAVADFQQAITLNPTLCNAYLELALAYQQQGQADEADRHLEQALRHSPPPTVLADFHAERSRVLYQQKNYDESLKACALALNLHPQSAVAHALRGRILMQLREYKQATASFDLYLKLGGKPVADIYRARGWAYFFSDDWQPAARDFEDALRLNSENGELYVGRGLARVMLGQYRQAAGDAETALERKLATPEMMHNVACIFSLAASQAEHNDGLPGAAHYRE